MGNILKIDISVIVHENSVSTSLRKNILSNIKTDL
jgi:hypothetical protein